MRPISAVHDLSACAYYRVQLPLSRMAAHGYEVNYSSRLEPSAGDVFVVERAHMAHGSESHWMDLWKRTKMVLEVDDDLWTIDPSNRRAFEAYTPQVLAQFERAARVCHMITVSTEPLAEVMSKFNQNIVILPNSVDGMLFEVERPHHELLTIGWAGGDSHRRDWEHVHKSLKTFQSRNPDVRFHTIGENPTNWGLRFKHDHTSWQPDLIDYYSRIDFDIGIAPLIDNVFNRSKSPIKAVEYAALGIPVVASNVTPYKEFVIDGVTGILVDKDYQWARALSDLVNDEAMRLEMGRNAKEFARKHFSIEDNWALWRDAYASLG